MGMNLRDQLDRCDKRLAKGDIWYLVDNQWFNQLKRYAGDLNMGEYGEVGEESANPGPINNKPLFKENGTEIRDHMIDGLDYALMPEEVWDVMVNNFGLVEGQEPIKRKVVEHGMFVKHCKVEVYLIELHLAENSNLEETKKKKFSKSDTLDDLQNVMKTEFNISPDANTRLWNKYSSNSYEQLSRQDITVQDAGLFSGQMIIIEVKNEDGTWPREVGYHRPSPKSFVTASASSSQLVDGKITISKEDVLNIQDKLGRKKTEHLEVEKSLVCVGKKLEELEKKQKKLEDEKKTLEVEKRSLSDRREKTNDEIKYLEDSLLKYVEATKDLVARLELGPALANSNLIAFLTKSIDEKEAALACPVCLETATGPIFMCQQQHLVCSSCQPRVSSCPECREAYQGPPRRHRYAERDAEELRKMQEELARMTS